MAKEKRIALYLRVSTAEQTVENQRRELKAVAERHGWNVVAVFKDEGISGTKGRQKRPGLGHDAGERSQDRQASCKTCRRSKNRKNSGRGHRYRSAHQGRSEGSATIIDLVSAVERSAAQTASDSLRTLSERPQARNLHA